MDSGAPANGLYTMRFALWDAPTAGSPSTGTLQTEVWVTNGLFGVVLDFGAEIFNGKAQWLEIQVGTLAPGGGFVTLVPRQYMAPAPAALYAPRAGMALSVPAANLSGTLGLAQLPATVMTNGSGAVGVDSTAVGKGTKAEGQGSTALGWYTHARGARSTALGSGTVADGWAATALGADSVATNYALAAGRRAQATNQGAFVWADSQEASFGSTAANQFLIRASGGVGINTPAPEAPLHVVGANAAAQLRVAAAQTAPNGAALSVDARATEGGKEYVMLATGAGASEGRGKLILRNQTDGLPILCLTSNGNVGIGTTAPREALEVAGGLVVGNSGNAAPKAGTIRWTGQDFEGYNGSAWVSLTGRGGSSTYPVTPLSNMVWIAPGSFVMGSPETEEDRQADESPQATVTISKGFWMGKYEVTQAEYKALMGSNPSWFNGDRRSEGGRDYGIDLNRPVESVGWSSAKEYCATLTERERAAGRIGPNCVYRLPTEAEWEYVCRAGTTTRFSHGDDPGYKELGKYAWHGASMQDGVTHPVGQKLPNPWGVYDMYGNVDEWCQDRYGSYTGGQLVDPQGPLSGLYRVIRGGNWVYAGRYCRSAFRNDIRPIDGNIIIGFRVILVPGPA